MSPHYKSGARRGIVWRGVVGEPMITSTKYRLAWPRELSCRVIVQASTPLETTETVYEKVVYAKMAYRFTSEHT